MNAAPADFLTAHALAQPDRVAVIDDRPGHAPLMWTFAELESQANRLANAMAALGVRTGDKVLWCGMNSAGVLRMMHAARKLGVTAVPLNYRLTAEEAGYILDDSDAIAVYADADMAPLFAALRPAAAKVRHWLSYGGPAPAWMLDAEALVAGAGGQPPPIDRAAVNPCTMIYTSGTTGRPKGAVRPVLGDPESLARLVAEIGYVREDVYLTSGPLYHSGPGGFASIAHLVGSTVVVQRKFDAEDWLRLVDAHRVTTTFTAPTPIRLVCQLDPAVKARYARTSMKRMIANAAPWSMALKRMYLADFPPDSLWEVYGSTELGVDTVLRPEDQLRKPGSCGRPAPGVDLALFDAEGNRIDAPRVHGDLYVRSRGSFVAYHKAAEKFERARRGEWLSVGDVAWFDEEGYWYIGDRRNDMIITGGMNVYPAEIEAALDQHPDVMDVAVVGIPDEQWGETVHAFVVRRDGTLTEQDLLHWARDHLAGYKLPRSIAWLEEIPRNASGKILKRTLRETWLAGHAPA
ncbi:MAG: AMP-binding protein [Gammaproteobacteria bacterium]